MEKLEFKGTSREWAIGRGLKIQTDPNDPMRTITIAQVFGSDALEINQANAHLIAAAPDLLEACIAVSEAREKALSTEDLFAVLEAIRHKVNPAISKALNTTSNE